MEQRPLKFRVWDGEQMRVFDARKWTEVRRALTRFVPATPVLPSYDEPHPEWPVMQFTGLLDEDGVEIYEGDVLEYDYGPTTGRGVIEWIDHAFWIRSQTGNDGHFLPNQRRVVGNIYEPVSETCQTVEVPCE